ncbi:uncharacterized protein LOC131876228 [Cryptomeria japonica]|uniref:uncharacterized protein LOC131876228 n=1 Tax=Cryptomeria japonica TaxID=3369 RepID=UPI0027DAA3DE|nr:uncharacterized protein LOC131876228 [Cryptomeria japonica]
MSDIEVFEEEEDTMPPKAMNSEAIKKLVEELLEEKLKEAEQSKEKGKADEDESEEEIDEDAKEMEKLAPNQKMFLNSLKSVNRDNVESLPTYGGSLNGEEVLDWIEALNNHFEYKEVPEEKRVSLAKSRLKGSALLWWTVVQEERTNEGKKKITSWERMKNKIKEQFLPIDYEV